MKDWVGEVLQRIPRLDILRRETALLNDSDDSGMEILGRS